MSYRIEYFNSKLEVCGTANGYKTLEEATTMAEDWLDADNVDIETAYISSVSHKDGIQLVSILHGE